MSKASGSCPSHVEACKSSPVSGGVSPKDGAQRPQHEYVRQHKLSILCFMIWESLNISKAAASCPSCVGGSSGGVSSKEKYIWLLSATAGWQQDIHQANKCVKRDSSFYSRASQRRSTEDRASYKHCEHCGYPNQGSGEGVVSETPTLFFFPEECCL